MITQVFLSLQDSFMRHYLAYKTGSGNCFRELALRGWVEKDGLPPVHLLYVGFSNATTQEQLDLYDAELRDAGDELEYETAKDHIALRLRLPSFGSAYEHHRSPAFQDNRKPVKKGDSVRRIARDDNYIAWAMHPDNHERVRLVTYFADTLCFWRPISSELVIASEDADDPSLRALFEKASELDPSRTKKEPRLYKFMRVEPAPGAVMRNEVYTSIDSLSVLQYLTQGTCRPFWKLHGTLPRLRGMKPCIPTPDGGKETVYGAFVRHYFDDIANRDVDEGLTAFVRSSKGLTWTDIARETMNPILVETAAYYFCLDLGLVEREGGVTVPSLLLPDVGVGKGIDVIDVRARLRTKDKDEIAKIKAKLARCVAGESGREALVDKLEKRGTLELQCKASEKDLSYVPPHVAYFGNTRLRKETERAQILLPKLFSEAKRHEYEWPHLSAFLGMQEESISAVMRIEVKTDLLG